jgi:hypothetical protein
VFHGIITRGRKWLRLLTGTPLLEGDNTQEEFTGGPYQPAFLENFFSGKYRVEIRKIKSRKLKGVNSEPAVARNELYSSEVIRWSTASDQYMLRIKGAVGWLSSFNEIGLIIRNSKKMSKRLVELVRLTSACSSAVGLQHAASSPTPLLLAGGGLSSSGRFTAVKLLL